MNYGGSNRSNIRKKNRLFHRQLHQHKELEWQQHLQKCGMFYCFGRCKKSTHLILYIMQISENV